VKILLNAGADVMARGTWDRITPVALAALSGETQFLPLLLPHLPETDLYAAAVLADEDRVKEILRFSPALAVKPDANGWQALRYAAGSRAGEGPESEARILGIARELLRRGADPDPALGPAIGSNKAALVEELMERGATLQSGDALAHAAEAGNFAALDVLARRGADLQCALGTEHHGGYTPLGCLLTLRSATGARWFLERGIDPNFVGGDGGETALHVAVWFGCSPATLRMLVEHGVDVNARDLRGQTALDVALAKERRRQASYLREIGAETS
jgi:ankyrin repeat protein